MLTALLPPCRRFLRDSFGNTGLIMALAAIPLFGAAGAAIDYGRLHAARSEVQSALDSAVLAGTRNLMEKGNKSQAVQAATTYFAKNLSSSIQLENSTIAFSINAAGTGVESTGNAEMKTAFMSVLNIPTMAIFPDSSASGSAAVAGNVGQGGNLEIALMLDVTGSMCDDGAGPCSTGSKLDGLKSAANQLINTVVWADQSTYTSKVSLIPFSERIRITPDGAPSPLMAKLTGMPPTWSGYVTECTAGYDTSSSGEGGGWVCTAETTVYKSNRVLMPCVTERLYDTTGLDYSDDAPGTGRWLMGHGGDRMPYFIDSSETTPSSQTGTASDPSTDWNYLDTAECGSIGKGDSMMPLTNDIAALQARISELSAEGMTAGALATQFSWFTLSPNWSDIWGTDSAPGSYADLSQKNANGSPKLRKIAVLMTDGAYNTLRSWTDDPPATVSADAVKMCDAMKAKGIEIYTVGFALNELTAAEQSLAISTLQSCGSGVDHFYNSLNVVELQGAFKAIGTKVAATSIRLTK